MPVKELGPVLLVTAGLASEIAVEDREPALGEGPIPVVASPPKWPVTEPYFFANASAST